MTAVLSPARKSRIRRPNVWLGKAIPLILLVFVWKGWELVLTEISESSSQGSRSPCPAADFAARLQSLMWLPGTHDSHPRTLSRCMLRSP